MLLARCLERLGPCRPVTPQLVRELTVGDREALLLHLRRATVGERIACVLRCPRPDCGEPMDLDLAVGDLLLPPYAAAAPTHETELAVDDTCWRLRFRLPTGRDQEEAALLARTDAAAAGGWLLASCIESVEVAEAGTGAGGPAMDGAAMDGRSAGGPAAGTGAGLLPAQVAERLGELMAELDPQAELLLRLPCPRCGHEFTAPFDTAAFFFHELAARVTTLYREVHRLALAYHWSEAEILALDGRRRRRYLELLAEPAAGRAS